jgi:hypothetical protein
MLSAGLISSATPVMSYCNSSNTASGEFHALLVGVTQYGPQEQLKKDRDCKELSTVLKRAGYKTAEIITGSIEVEVLTERLKLFASKASENDTLLFFFAGHGTQDGLGNDVLSLYNGNSINHLLVSAVVTTLKGSEAANIILVFDCCRRKVDRQDSTASFKPRLVDFTPSDSNSKKFMMIQACSPGQVSFEIDGPEEKASGLFTRALVDFITKADGYTTGRKLDNELKEVKVAGNTQNPVVSGDLSVVLCKGLRNVGELSSTKLDESLQQIIDRVVKTVDEVKSGRTFVSQADDIYVTREKLYRMAEKDWKGLKAGEKSRDTTGFLGGLMVLPRYFDFHSGYKWKTSMNGVLNSVCFTYFKEGFVENTVYLIYGVSFEVSMKSSDTDKVQAYLRSKGVAIGRYGMLVAELVKIDDDYVKIVVWKTTSKELYN